MKLGPWTFTIDAYHVEALHENYDGAPDSKQRHGYHDFAAWNPGATLVTKLRALRSLVDQLIEFEEEREDGSA